MGKSRHLPDIINNIVLAVALVAVWMLFAPVKLGGQVSYVLVDGTSMLPKFHGGDLVILRQASTYQIGEVVAYQDALMNAHVIHRVISLEADHFILKGDNNSWIDDYQPTREEIVGKLWIHLPKAGMVVAWIRKPLNLAMTTGLIGGLFMITMTTQKPDKKSKKKNTTPSSSTGLTSILLYIFGFLGLVFLTILIVAFTHPITRTADAIKYKQIGNFSYSAAGSPTVYDTGAAVAGEPVFTRMACKLNLAFAYTLQGQRLDNISGSQKLYALIQDDGNGWKRTVPIMAETRFSGNTATSQATLDLCQLQTLVATVEQETGVALNSYSLVILAHIAISGDISGQNFKDTFEPRLTFGFGSLDLYLPRNTSGTDPLQTVKPGTLNDPSLVENKILRLGLNPSVSNLRTIGMVGIGISLLGLLVVFIFYSIGFRADPGAIVRAKYGGLMIDVTERGLESLSPVIDVTTIDDLAKLAERQNVMIMHLKHADVDFYIVQIEGKAYRYVSSQDQMATPG